MARDLFGFTGTTIDGQFRVDALVGEGGTSVVYRGFHLGLNENIAIKCLKIAQGQPSHIVTLFTRRFRDESRIAYRLSQGNLHIVRCMTSGETRAPTGAAVPYMVLEWLEGRTLAQDFEDRQRSGKGARDLPDVMRVFAASAEALAYAHAHGVVHRDVKPGNLFFAKTREGERLKVLDFGLAKLLADQSLGLSNPAQTMGQATIFSPAYAAPEQFDPTLGQVSARTDVYSFALVLLEAIRGSRVRVANGLPEYLLLACDPNRPPVPSALGLQLPPAVDQLFSRAVSVRPEGRPADVGAFWGELRHALATSGGPEAARAAMPSLIDESTADEGENPETMVDDGLAARLMAEERAAAVPAAQPSRPPLQSFVDDEDEDEPTQAYDPAAHVPAARRSVPPTPEQALGPGGMLGGVPKAPPRPRPSRPPPAELAPTPSPVAAPPQAVGAPPPRAPAFGTTPPPAQTGGYQPANWGSAPAAPQAPSANTTMLGTAPSPLGMPGTRPQPPAPNGDARGPITPTAFLPEHLRPKPKLPHAGGPPGKPSEADDEIEPEPISRTIALDSSSLVGGVTPSPVMGGALGDAPPAPPHPGLTVPMAPSPVGSLPPGGAPPPPMQHAPAPPPPAAPMPMPALAADDDDAPPSVLGGMSASSKLPIFIGLGLLAFVVLAGGAYVLVVIVRSIGAPQETTPAPSASVTEQATTQATTSPPIEPTAAPTETAAIEPTTTAAPTDTPPEAPPEPTSTHRQGERPSPTAAPTATPHEVAPGAFDEARARKSLDSIAGILASCKKKDGPTGKGLVSVTFLPSGKVSLAKVDGAPYAGTPTGTCVEKRFKLAHAPKFDGSPQTLSHPFNIRK